MKFNLHTDHHFALGFEHLTDGKPCQDHALSGVVSLNGFRHAFAVISDGCSSAGETDIGARILTTLTAKAMRQETYDVDDELFINSEAFDIAYELDLKYEDLLATHVYAVIDDEGRGSVTVKGDGVVAFMWSGGDITIYQYEWAKNLPYYPLYESLDDFYQEHGGRDAKALKVSCWRQVADGLVIVSEVEHTVDEGCRGLTLPIAQPVGDSDILSAIVLFTDGVSRVDKIDLDDAIRQLTAFPSRHGVFVKRRLNQFIKRANKIGHGPLDDLAMAVITIEPKIESDQNG